MCGSTTILLAPTSFDGLQTVDTLRNQWPEFLDAHEWIEFCTIGFEKVIHIAKSRYIRLQRRLGESFDDVLRPGLATLLWEAGRALLYSASDPRDKIFALLGLVDVDIQPDYLKNKVEVYTEFARKCIDIGEFTILSRAGIGLCNDAEEQTSVLPSWVPDWNAFSGKESPALWRVPSNHAFRDEGNFRPRSIDGVALSWSGVIWHSVSRTKTEKVSSIRPWDLMKGESISRIPLYPSGILRMQALVLLMFGGSDPLQLDNATLEVETESFYTSAAAFFRGTLTTFRKFHCPEANLRDTTRKFKQYFHLPEGDEYEDQLLRDMFSPRDDWKQSKWSSISDMLLSSYAGIPYDTYLTQIVYACRTRSAFNTQKGYIGLGPVGSNIGDLVCTLQGFYRPVILRKVDSHYVLVGQCYVPGIMNGEILEAVEAGRRI